MSTKSTQRRKPAARNTPAKSASPSTDVGTSAPAPVVAPESAITVGPGETATLYSDPESEASALREEVRALRADRTIREANANANAAPRRSPLDLLRASPWLLIAVVCLLPLFWLVGSNFAELLLWPVAKTALIVFLVYWADRSLHKAARLHWYSLALLQPRAGEACEITHLRDTVPVAALVWLAIGAWLRRGLMLAALIAVFAKAY